jgi:hypothetical protein
MSARRTQLAGWWLFVFCALCYLVTAWRASDPWSVVGSVLFLAGCFAFMIPLLRESIEIGRARRGDAER